MIYKFQKPQMQKNVREVGVSVCWVGGGGGELIS